MTVSVCPSIDKRWMPSAPELIRRRRCVLPVSNLNLEMPALLVHGVVSPGATVEQSKFILPFIKLLWENTFGLPFGASISSMSSWYPLWYQSVIREHWESDRG